MKLTKIVATIAIIVSLNISTTFAATRFVLANTNNQQINIEKNDSGLDKYNQDPIKLLENKKAEIQSDLSTNKISKEKASEIAAKIDAKINKIKEFNTLNLQEKKDKLKSTFKSKVENKVKDGKLTQEKANEIVKRYNDKVNSWDGNGYPKFCYKYFGFKFHHEDHNVGR